METSRLKESRDIVKHLEEERGREDERFKQISEYILPHRGYWPGDGDTKDAILERGKKNINPAATLAIERAAAGMTVGMTPEGQPWYSLTLKDKELLEKGGVREYLAYCERLISVMLQSGGFYQAIHYCNMELFGFGNLLLFQDSSPVRLSRFEACTMGTYCVALDADGVLDTVIRRFKWSVGQIAKKYGEEKLSKKSKELLNLSPYTKVDIVHVVNPRENYNPKAIDAMNMPYRSVIYEDTMNDDKEGDVLNESGFHEMPYSFARHSIVGDSAYGMGPGHLLIGHTKGLNETERQKLIALQKIISPPMRKPANMKDRLDVRPGAENAVSQSDKDGLMPLYEVPYQGYNSVLQEIQDVELRIAAVAKADLFYDLPAEMRPKDMTLGEYMERKRERMQQLAPVVSQYEPEVLDHTVTRCYNILERTGLLPDPPPILAEAGAIEIEYVSSVAKALRQVGAESTRALLLDVGNLAKIQVESGMKPTALQKVDVAQAVDEIANGVGSPARVIRSDEEYEEIMAAEAQADAQRQQQEMEKEALDSAAKLGNTRTEGTLAGKMVE